jgi:hypothetical protein
MTYGTGAPTDEAEDETSTGSEGNGTETEGIAVVPTTLARGSPDSGVTTGFECGGGVTTGRTEEALDDGATFTPDGTPGCAGVNSIGGWSPPTSPNGASPGAAPEGEVTGTTPVPITTPASTPSVTSTTPAETEGSGNPERTRQN